MVSNIESYKVGAYYLFPTYHGCQHRNRNGTRKKIQYNKGEQCINPVHTACWRKTKKKYLSPKVYNTTYWRKFYKNSGFFLTSLLLNWSKIWILSTILQKGSLLKKFYTMLKLILWKYLGIVKIVKNLRFYSIKSELEKKGFFNI